MDLYRSPPDAVTFTFPDGSGYGEVYGFSSDGTKICGSYIDSDTIERPIVWTSNGTIYEACV
uniref:Uncharacterized protein n=1 Tax=viral metagenome TaxID=1070528 RepID=A0A6C0HQN8_9ZZZZ